MASPSIGAAEDARAWLAKVESDLDMIRRALLPPAILDGAAFHAQQAAGKAIKALLVLDDIPPPAGRKGHDLALVAGCLPETHPLRLQALALAPLTRWATASRCPAEAWKTAMPLPTADEVRAWLARIEAFHDAVLRLIPLPGPP